MLPLAGAERVATWAHGRYGVIDVRAEVAPCLNEGDAPHGARRVAHNSSYLGFLLVPERGVL